MNQQFLKLYMIITVSLTALVLSFGQMYNYFFSAQTPSLQLSVNEFRKLIDEKDTRVKKVNASELILSPELQTNFENEGILSVTLESQSFVYLKGFNKQIYRVGPVELMRTPPTDWVVFMAFYLLLGGIILLFIRPVFRDLSLLQNAAKCFSKKPEKIILPIKSNSSIAPLAGTFTEMSERIESFILLHSDLSRIISHEIRTPLSRMRFALSISELEPDENSQIEHDIDEIEVRLEQYLSFARLEHQQTVFNQKKVNLASLINTEIHKFKLYTELEFKVDFQIIDAWCEHSFMAIAVQNLLINATKYAKHSIQIKTQKSNGIYTIYVTDDGPGLPLNANALIEPFKQGEGDVLASGYGLGLYIVDRIATWHGGKINLTNHTTSGGARISIQWPKNDK